MPTEVPVFQIKLTEVDEQSSNNPPPRDITVPGSYLPIYPLGYLWSDSLPADITVPIGVQPRAAGSIVDRASGTPLPGAVRLGSRRTEKDGLMSVTLLISGVRQPFNGITTLWGEKDGSGLAFAIRVPLRVAYPSWVLPTIVFLVAGLAGLFGLPWVPNRRAERRLQRDASNADGVLRSYLEWAKTLGEDDASLIQNVTDRVHNGLKTLKEGGLVFEEMTHAAEPGTRADKRSVARAHLDKLSSLLPVLRSVDKLLPLRRLLRRLNDQIEELLHAENPDASLRSRLETLRPKLHRASSLTNYPKARSAWHHIRPTLERTLPRGMQTWRLPWWWRLADLIRPLRSQRQTATRGDARQYDDLEALLDEVAPLWRGLSILDRWREALIAIIAALGVWIGFGIDDSLLAAILAGVGIGNVASKALLPSAESLLGHFTKGAS